jgi:hypothetical protein
MNITTEELVDNPTINFPNIPLCPLSSDAPLHYYIYCFILLTVYFLSVVTILTWNIRAIFYWYKDRKNGYGSDKHDSDIELGNKRTLSGMLPKRSDPTL